MQWLRFRKAQQRLPEPAITPQMRYGGTIEMAKSMIERYAATMKKVKEGDPTFWRHPVAEAVVEMFAEGKQVTPESIIAHLRENRHVGDVILHGLQVEAAMERLRQIVVKKDRDD